VTATEPLTSQTKPSPAARHGELTMMDFASALRWQGRTTSAQREAGDPSHCASMSSVCASRRWLRPGGRSLVQSEAKWPFALRKDYGDGARRRYRASPRREGPARGTDGVPGARRGTGRLEIEWAAVRIAQGHWQSPRQQARAPRNLPQPPLPPSIARRQSGSPRAYPRTQMEPECCTTGALHRRRTR